MENCGGSVLPDDLVGLLEDDHRMVSAVEHDPGDILQIHVGSWWWITSFSLARRKMLAGSPSLRQHGTRRGPSPLRRVQ